MAAGVNDTFRQVGVAVGTAAWGAVFLARGSSKVSSLLAGTHPARGAQPRHLLEALTGGQFPAVTRAVPPDARQAVVHATHQGFLAGLNSILVIGGIVAFVGAALALWLVREREIERDRPDAVPAPSEAVEYLAA